MSGTVWLIGGWTPTPDDGVGERLVILDVMASLVLGKPSKCYLWSFFFCCCFTLEIIASPTHLKGFYTVVIVLLWNGNVSRNESKCIRSENLFSMHHARHGHRQIVSPPCLIPQDDVSPCGAPR